MKTPVAFLIFNRPETTERVFAEIARARPAKLLVVADGPRASRPEEAELCRAARSVVERIDWDCELLTNFAETNLGCKNRVSSGITWVFNQVEEAIVLEDDCLPHPSFFPFCEELLERYRTDERVMSVSGDNFQFGRARSPHSYYFSCYPHIWGWASWRRAWRHYDVGMSAWPALRDTDWPLAVVGDKAAARYWREAFENVYAGRVDTWDYQWVFACWSRQGLAALPETNLVTNIGWGGEATHTGASVSPLGNIPAAEMGFPLRHPPHVSRHAEADRYTFERVFEWFGHEPTAYGRLHRKVTGLLPPGLRGPLSALKSGLTRLLPQGAAARPKATGRGEGGDA
ncbi:MAG TPA: hypothetical protein VEQ42_11110 [Pyrinomonadaceae bacterium]|nr:hypothetical protein [Pyrinomonadaceae bacterium]